MIKKRVTTVLLLAAVMSYMPAGAQGQEIAASANSEADSVQPTGYAATAAAITSGECGAQGNNVRWAYKNGTLTISGSGYMRDFNGASPPWREYDNQIYRVYIQEGVTSIGSYAFGQIWWINEIRLPDALAKIGAFAFASCQEFNTINIPASVREIGDGVFVGCSGLKSVRVPEGVERIGSSAFGGCRGLTRLELPASAVEIDARCLCEGNGVTYIYVDEGNPNYSSKDGVLFNKEQTELLAYAKDKTEPDYTVPDGVEIIQMNALQGCQWLKNIELPDGIKTIEWSSFRGCVELLRMDIPNSIQSIINPFSNCDKLGEIVIDRAQGVVEGGPEGAPNAEIIYLREMHAEVLAETAYTGREIEPAIKISERRRDGTATRILAEKEEYIPYYSDNINAGTAKIEVCYIGDYIHLPNSELTFQITPRSCAGLTIAPIPNQACTGRAITPNPVITDNEI